MSGESFEWAIKKDVRNNPIVREVDLERHRDMWRSVGFSVLLVLVLLVSAWQHIEFYQYGYQMSEMQDALDKERMRTRKLRLEIETLSAQPLVEHEAKRRLHMVRPGPGEYVVIERVVEAPAPPKSVVAQR
jgi:cell division protein FtsB